MIFSGDFAPLQQSDILEPNQPTLKKADGCLPFPRAKTPAPLSTLGFNLFLRFAFGVPSGFELLALFPLLHLLQTLRESMCISVYRKLIAGDMGEPPFDFVGDPVDGGKSGELRVYSFDIWNGGEKGQDRLGLLKAEAAKEEELTTAFFTANDGFHVLHMFKEVCVESKTVAIYKV